MHQHVKPLHLIGVPSPGDVVRLILRLVEVQARRAGDPVLGEPLLQDATITCHPAPSGDDECRHFEVVAVARCPGAAEVKCRFHAELRFTEEGQGSADRAGADLVKELAWPAIRDALREVALMLTATATVRPTPPTRHSLLDRVRQWAARRAAAAVQ